MFEGIEYRGFGQEIVEDLAKYSSVPVWNGLTNEYHPTQMLADMLTIKEKLGRLKGVKFVYMGDARYNMGNSLMIVCSKLGLHFTACTAKEYFPDEALVNQCKEWAAQSGGSVTLTEDVEEGTKGAEVLYTDVWVSMGEPDEVWNERIKALLPYQINKRLWIMQIRKLYLCIAFQPSMILRQLLVNRYMISLVLMRWKLQMKCLNQNSQ